MKRSRFASLGVALVATSIAHGQAEISRMIESPAPPVGGWTRLSQQIPKIAAAPSIDGKLDDACWKEALHERGFYRFVSKDPVHEQTEVWMCADKEKIYLAFHCLESNPNSVSAKETQRNGNLEQDDRIGVVIDSQGTRRNASVFWVNARGTQNQEMEGGTADNQAWQGDWHAATTKTADGWIVEMAVPFRLLRYPKNARKFGMLVVRKKSSETNFTSWPYAPPECDNGRVTQFLGEFDGIEPPAYAPKPIVLPYTLATTGEGNSARFGLDVKYPFSTTLTGVATVKPDFQTVEGAVTDLSFSYTEKFVPDRRPFFAEGGGFLDDSFLFYSQRISDVDFGLKVTGKQGPTTIGLLSTAAGVGTKQQAKVFSFDQELGSYSNIGATFLENRESGSFGQVAQARLQYGWAKGLRKSTFFGNVTASKNEGDQKGNSYYLQFRTNAGKNQLNGNAYLVQTDKGFGNPLGLVDNVDIKGAGINVFTFNVFDKGAIEDRDYYLNLSSFDHIDGSFFQKALYYGTDYNMRNGWSYSLGGSVGQREEFHDRLVSASVGWNRKTLLSKGGVSIDQGRRENKDYRFVAVNQGVPIGKRMSLNFSLGQQDLGGDLQNQAVLSGTYRIDPMQSFGGRLVAQGGNTNLYLSYGKRTRKGNDIFLLIGDPNSQKTRHSISLKMVWSL